MKNSIEVHEFLPKLYFTFWTSHFFKIDIFVSSIGAVYLDSKCNLFITWCVIEKIYGQTLSTIVQKPPKNSIAQLHEKFPDEVKFGNPEVRKNDGKVSMLLSIESIQRKFRGIGVNKKMAKLAAAKCALSVFRKKL